MSKKKQFSMREYNTFLNRGKIIESHVKKRKEIIHGGQAMKKQMGAYARGTSDYDILSARPQGSALSLRTTLNTKAGGKYYFYTPSTVHKGTHKVKHIGVDMVPRTKDDIHVADVTKFTRPVSTRKIDGVKYVKLVETQRDKRKSLKQAEFKFRHGKDKNDLNRIWLYKNVKRY